MTIKLDREEAQELLELINIQDIPVLPDVKGQLKELLDSSEDDDNEEEV